MARYLASVNSSRELLDAWNKVKEKAPFNIIFFEMRCKYCNSREISKYGRYKNTQRWWCKSCQRKFTDNRAPPGMKTPSNMIKSAVSLYYKGVSIGTIRRQLQEEYNYYPSESLVHKWIYRDTEKTLERTQNDHPQVGPLWVILESSIVFGADKFWIMDLVDLKTHFLLALKLSINRDVVDVKQLVKAAVDKAQKLPLEIVVKKKYFKAIEAEFGSSISLANNKYPLEKMNFTEYWKYVLKVRRRILCRQKLFTFAQLTLNGWAIYQNYVVIQKSLREKTAAQKAGITFPEEVDIRETIYRL